MAVARLVEVKDAGQKEYDRIIGLLKTDTNPPTGGLVHVAGPGPGSWRVFDLWETEQAIRDYERDRLVPTLKQSGLGLQPRTELYTINNILLPDRTALTQLTGKSAVGLIVDIVGVTEQQYNRVNDVVGIVSEPPNGLILHTAGVTHQGLRVFDIWTSEQAFRDFRNNRLNSGFKEAGITAQPRLEVFPIHRVQVTNIQTLSKLGVKSMRA